MLIELDKIRTNGGTQVREEITAHVVWEYAELMKEGVKFPPVAVYFDGKDYWLADGFHRCQAARSAGIDQIEADVIQGTRRDAILHSVGANAEHGLRRSRADKERAVMMLLNDEEWRKWSTREVARRCGVSKSFVADLRKSLSATDSEERTYTTRHGTKSKMKTGKIGKGRKRIVTKEQYEAEAKAQAEAGERAQEDTPAQEDATDPDAQVPAGPPAAADPVSKSIASVSVILPKDPVLMAAALMDHFGLEFSDKLAEELARVVKEKSQAPSETQSSGDQA
ncbi:MAG: ParB N-terminal domain-containing protein [Phycisphaerae bacterium]